MGDSIDSTDPVAVRKERDRLLAMVAIVAVVAGSAVAVVAILKGGKELLLAVAATVALIVGVALAAVGRFSAAPTQQPSPPPDDSA